MGTIPNQITPTAGVQPYTNQQNFGQLIGEVLARSGNHTPTPVIQNIIGNAVRTYYDRRLWYGLMTKGQLISPGYYSTGTVTLTQGSTTVTGNSTNWTASLGGQPIIGQQLRIGFTAPIYTIVDADLVSSPQTLTLELPWGNQSVSSTGYFIAQYYYSIPNIKYIYSIKNLQMMFRMCTNVPQSLIENWDPARLQMIYPRVLAGAPPDSSGNMVFEMWPVPNFSQAFPYIAYIQPPNLVNDSDNVPPYMRCDVIKLKALSEALMFSPRTNPNYSEATCLTLAGQYLKQFEYEIEKAAQADENAYRTDIVTQWETLPYPALDPATGSIMGGSYMAAMYPVMAGGWGDDW